MLAKFTPAICVLFFSGILALRYLVPVTCDTMLLAIALRL